MSGSQDSNKPYKGEFIDWRIERSMYGEYVTGVFRGHPQFDGKTGYSSIIVKKEYGENGYDIETRNSRYHLPYDHEDITNYN